MSSSPDFERLASIGLSARIQQQAVALVQQLAASNIANDSSNAPRLMRLTEVHRDSVRIDDGESAHHAQVVPRLARQLVDCADELTVGDWIFATPDANGDMRIVQRLAPLNRIVRRDAHGGRHVLVSNVDTALLTMGLDEDFSLRRVERFFSLVHASGVEPVIVLTKADTVGNAQTLYARQRIMRERLGAEAPIMCVDARDADTAARLQPFTQAGKTLVVLGSSGAGKSTLTNTLLGRQAQDTGAVREHDSRGKHTTRARALFRLPGGACIIDTPGLRALRADADAQAVAASFTEIQALAGNCRFRNCRHLGEPGCIVRETIDEDRLGNYHKLLREAQRDVMSPLQRRQQLAVWKARSKASRARQARTNDPD